MSLLDQYRVGPIKGLNPVEEKPQPQQLNENLLEVYSSGNQEEESQVPRHAARTASRIGETIAGYPGDVRQFSEAIEDKALQFLPEKIRQPAKKIMEEFIPGRKTLKSAPTSEQLQKASESLTKGFTSPQSTGESEADEFTKLVTNLFTGKGEFDPKSLKGLSNIGKAIFKSGAQAGGGMAAGKGTESLTGSKTAGELAKNATIFLSSFMGKPTVKTAIKDQYNKSNSLLNDKDFIITRDLYKDLEKAKESLTTGLEPSSKSIVLGHLNTLLKKVKNGAVKAKDLVESYHDLNEIMGEKKLFTELGKPELNLLKGRFNEHIRGPLNKALDQYGKKNPEWHREWRSANEAMRVDKEGMRTHKWFVDNLKNLKNQVGAGLIGQVFGTIPVAKGITAGVVLGETGGQIYRFFNNSIKSPVLRNHYMNLMKSLSQENLPSTVRALKNIEKDQGKRSEE